MDALADLLPIIESALDDAAVFDLGCPAVLSEAIRYSLLAPGKRLRPALVLMATEACGGQFDTAMPAAVAVEMVHAYSLIHDDLPAMDDDETRRGRPTCHIKFGEANAILAGDALLTRAFEVLADAKRMDDRIAAVRLLAQAAGASSLVGGQVDDLAAETSGEHSLEHLQSIHRRKTGALFHASVTLGGLAANANGPQLDALEKYAETLGLAFQVVDDVLDHTGASTQLGKNSGRDIERGKLTYPGLLGLQGARDHAEQLITSACQALGLFSSGGWRLRWLAEYVFQRIG